MKQIKIGDSYVCYKEFKILENENLQDFLENKKLEKFVKSFDKNIVFVLGGDGTMLEAVRKHYKKELPFLGINFGTKGFFLNPKKSVTPNLSYILEDYPLLEVIDDNTGESEIAMNEIDVRSKNGKISTFDINIGGKQSFSIDGDGIIIATPQGSTGYNSSLGGPILLKDSKSFVITAKAPWKPKLFPSVIISDDKEIHVSNLGRKNPIYIFTDGDKIFKPDDTKNSSTFTIKKSKYCIKLIIAKDYIDVWQNKIFDL